MTNFVYSDINELLENYSAPVWRKAAVRRFMQRHPDWAEQLTTDPGKFFAAIMKYDFLEQPIGKGRHLLQITWHDGLYSRVVTYIVGIKVNIEAKRLEALIQLWLDGMALAEEIGLHQRLGFFDAKPKD